MIVFSAVACTGVGHSVGGDPGMDPDASAPQVAGHLATLAQKPVLYITSEESASQTAMCADLQISSRPPAGAGGDEPSASNQIQKVEPCLAIVDSIEMIYKSDLPAAPGSLVTQLRVLHGPGLTLPRAREFRSCSLATRPKEGTLAGPKIVEHIVDTVAYFEGDRFHTHRILRCMKNRFGIDQRSRAL